MESVGFRTLVPPLPERRLGAVPDILIWLGEAAVLLLEVPSAVPAVCVLAEALSSLVVDAFGVSDGGSENATQS